MAPIAPDEATARPALRLMLAVRSMMETVLWSNAIGIMIDPVRQRRQASSLGYLESRKRCDVCGGKGIDDDSQKCWNRGKLLWHPNKNRSRVDLNLFEMIFS